MEWLAILYITAVNLAAFATMYADKQKARNNHWRVPESRIWTLSILGGAAGAWSGMRTFRHKTKHASFRIGLPLLTGIQLFAAAAWLQFLLF
ncbi:DUF1294 domain-containing protein [Bacillus lacus]|uniref:DUF1294 domain-containing protein n=1 Tax=Metabacillus lacus TaxID=1983721 RepID=A0A7X2IY26_9BACI|nr:DUF1294 domain-containing protein [Metabacillus lacus]MRX71786.1 DUF1294 domain-containing protein [Metabacillus lacus]